MKTLQLDEVTMCWCHIYDNHNYHHLQHCYQMPTRTNNWGGAFSAAASCGSGGGQSGKLLSSSPIIIVITHHHHHHHHWSDKTNLARFMRVLAEKEPNCCQRSGPRGLISKLSTPHKCVNTINLFIMGKHPKKQYYDFVQNAGWAEIPQSRVQHFYQKLQSKYC